MSEVDFDRQILEAKQLIEALEEKKAKQETRNEGMIAFDSAVREIFNKFGLTERDLFLMKSAPIVEWVKNVGEAETQPGFYEDLKDYFYKLLEKDVKSDLRKKTVPKAKKIPGAVKPTLVIGVYRNPITEEVVEKKRRNPKPLDLWLEEFGLETVSSWKQD